MTITDGLFYNIPFGTLSQEQVPHIYNRTSAPYHQFLFYNCKASKVFDAISIPYEYFLLNTTNGFSEVMKVCRPIGGLIAWNRFLPKSQLVNSIELKLQLDRSNFVRFVSSLLKEFKLPIRNTRGTSKNFMLERNFPIKLCGIGFLKHFMIYCVRFKLSRVTDARFRGWRRSQPPLKNIKFSRSNFSRVPDYLQLTSFSPGLCFTSLYVWQVRQCLQF